MATATQDVGIGVARGTAISSSAASRYLLLVVGAVLWLFSVGGRWDLPFAPWLFSVLLLRFSRTSRIGPALGWVLAASVGAALFWLWQLAIPLVPSSIVGSIAYGVVFTIPFALDRLLWRRLPRLAGLLLFPAALAACEFLASAFSPLGASYGLLAVTQYADLPLLQVISVVGPYVIGFLIGTFATVANDLWQAPKSARGVVGIYVAVLVAIVLAGGLRLAFFPPLASFVRVAGLTPSRSVLDAANRVLGKPMLGAMHPVSPADQAAIDPTRLAPAYGLVEAELLANTRSAARAGARIVVWSENAMTVRAQDEPALIAKAAEVARQEHIYIDLALNIPFQKDRTHLIAPDGRVLWTYDKSHPIPGMEVYAPGPGQAAAARTPWTRLANVICYDADFPSMMHGTADLMLVPGGDWPQIGAVHTLRMAGLRAIENGYSLLRVDYNGLSALIDYQGHVLATQDTTGPGQHILIADAPARGATTLYSRTGDVFAWLCLGSVILLIGSGLRRRTTNQAQEAL